MKYSQCQVCFYFVTSNLIQNPIQYSLFQVTRLIDNKMLNYFKLNEYYFICDIFGNVNFIDVFVYYQNVLAILSSVGPRS